MAKFVLWLLVVILALVVTVEVVYPIVSSLLAQAVSSRLDTLFSII